MVGAGAGLLVGGGAMLIIDDGGAGFMSGMPPFVTMMGGFMGDFQQAAVSPVATSRRRSSRQSEPPVARP